MSPVDLAMGFAEASLRAAPALLLLLVVVRLVSSDARARRALLLAAILSIPALPILAGLLPGIGFPIPVFLGDRNGSTAIDLPSMDGVTLPVLAVLWATGALLMTTRLVVGCVNVRARVRTAAVLSEPAWTCECARIAGRLGLARVPELRLDPGECTPHAWGVAASVVVLPASAMGWSAGRRRAVLAHELGHLMMHEPLARVLSEVVRAAHWFDPVVRLVVRRLRRESEIAADHVALRAGIEPDEYIGHLVALARTRVEPDAGSIAATFRAPGELEHRVRALVGDAAGRRPVRGLRPSIAAAVALILVCSGSVPRPLPAAPAAERWARRYGISVDLAGVILAAAREEEIEAPVAFGLVAIESGFDSGRISSGGAVGLTQILPATARRVQPGISGEELTADAINLRVGFRYLRSQIDRERGDIIAALAAYRYGPGRIDRLRARGRPLPTDYADVFNPIS